jgi:hypothetical protein
MKTLFLILRVTTGLMATSALLILLAIILLRSGAAFAKESVGVLGYVGSLFTSGFTKGTPPKEAGWVVSWPQAGLALLFVAMIKRRRLDATPFWSNDYFVQTTSEPIPLGDK